MNEKSVGLLSQWVFLETIFSFISVIPLGYYVIVNILHFIKGLMGLFPLGDMFYTMPLSIGVLVFLICRMIVLFKLYNELTTK